MIYHNEYIVEFFSTTTKQSYYILLSDFQIRQNEVWVITNNQRCAPVLKVKEEIILSMMLEVFLKKHLLSALLLSSRLVDLSICNTPKNTWVWFCDCLGQETIRPTQITFCPFQFINQICSKQPKKFQYLRICILQPCLDKQDSLDHHIIMLLIRDNLRISDMAPVLSWQDFNDNTINFSFIWQVKECLVFCHSNYGIELTR